MPSELAFKPAPQNQPGTALVPPPPPEARNPTHRNVMVIIAVLISMVFVTVTIMTLFALLDRRRHRHGRVSPNGRPNSEAALDEIDALKHFGFSRGPRPPPKAVRQPYTQPEADRLGHRSRALRTVSTIFGVGLHGSKTYDRQARRDCTTGNSSTRSSVAMINKRPDERRRSNLAVASVCPRGEMGEEREAWPSSFSRQGTLVAHAP